MARYEDWHHLRVEGDKAAARALLPLARKVLGEAVEQAGVNKLGVHKVVHRLPNGGQVIGEVIGAMRRATIIVPPPGPGRRPVRVFDDFVVSSGDRGFEDGSPVWPSVILRYKQDASWAAYFYSDSSPGAGSSTAPKVGSYLSAFPLYRESSYFLYPASKTWMDDEGNAVAYAAPVGPFESPYRHPATMYGTGVHALGRLAFSLSEAAYAAGWRVLAAARKGLDFYALIAQLGALPDDPRPDPSAPLQTWAPAPFTSAASTYALLRVPATEADDPISGQRYLKADIDAAEQLWSDTLIRAYGIWEFNADCTELVTFQLPEHSLLQYAPGASGTFAPSTTDALTTTTYRIALTIGETAASLAVTNAGDAIYEAQGLTLRLVQDAPYTLDYVLGEQRIPALRAARTPSGFEETHRHVLYADLRNARFVFREQVRVSVASVDTVTDRIVAAGPEGETVVVEETLAGYSGPTADAMGGIFLWHETHFKALDDIEAQTPSALTRVYAGAYGTFWVDTEVGTENPPWYGLATADTALVTQRALNAQGASFGGVSVSADGSLWDSSVGLGYIEDMSAGAAGIGYFYDPAAFCARAAASTDRALAFISTAEGLDAYYLTNGTLPGYYGGASAMNGKLPFGIYLLGRPLLSQPYDREGA